MFDVAFVILGLAILGSQLTPFSETALFNDLYDFPYLGLELRVADSIVWGMTLALTVILQTLATTMFNAVMINKQMKEGKKSFLITASIIVSMLILFFIVLFISAVNRASDNISSRIADLVDHSNEPIQNNSSITDSELLALYSEAGLIFTTYTDMSKEWKKNFEEMVLNAIQSQTTNAQNAAQNSLVEEIFHANDENTEKEFENTKTTVVQNSSISSLMEELSGNLDVSVDIIPESIKKNIKIILGEAYQIGNMDADVKIRNEITNIRYQYDTHDYTPQPITNLEQITRVIRSIYLTSNSTPDNEEQNVFTSKEINYANYKLSISSQNRTQDTALQKSIETEIKEQKDILKTWLLGLFFICIFSFILKAASGVEEDKKEIDTTKEPPVERVTPEDTHTNEPPVEKVTPEDTHTKEPSVEKATLEDTHTKEPPIEKVTPEDTHTKETPVVKVTLEDTPTKEPPVVKVTLEDTPTSEPPVENVAPANPPPKKSKSMRKKRLVTTLVTLFKNRK